MKRRIVLASVLKPVNDTRMFEKMGVSLAESGHYEIHIVGYPSSFNERTENVHFHPLNNFKRIGFGRIVARLKVLQITIKVKPELLIVTTHELLIVAILFRIFFGTRIIYDIQENYWKNILYTNAFPKGFRTLIASLVRLKEILTAPFFTSYFLAEKCYTTELTFVKNKFTILENKCKVPEGFQRRPETNFIRMIFTGTLAESTGVLQAIDLVKKLHVLEPRIRLSIIGYCSQKKLLEKIENEAAQNDFINLIGGNSLIPHETIMHAISAAHFGIIYYPPAQHIENRIPTKLFEYLACQLPIVLQNIKPWVAMCAPYHAAVPFDFDQQDIESIWKRINSTTFYSKIPVGVSWQDEQEKLINLVRSVF